MTRGHMPASGRAAALRRAFDQSFAEAPTTNAVGSEDLLTVRIGAMLYALRITEISGVFSDVKITPVPTDVSELLGIGAIRGSVLPVYDLRALLGLGREGTPRWLAVAAATPLALAFDHFVEQLRVRPDAIVSHGGGDSAPRHVSEIVRVDGMPRPIVSVPSILERIRTRLRAAEPDKE